MSLRPVQFPIFTRAGRPWTVEQEKKELRIELLNSLAAQFERNGFIVEEEACPDCSVEPLHALVTPSGGAVIVYCQDADCGWFREIPASEFDS